MEDNNLRIVRDQAKQQLRVVTHLAVLNKYLSNNKKSRILYSNNNCKYQQFQAITLKNPSLRKLLKKIYKC